MDAKRNRNKMLADTNESGYVWTGPSSRSHVNGALTTSERFEYYYYKPW